MWVLLHLPCLELAELLGYIDSGFPSNWDNSSNYFLKYSFYSILFYSPSWDYHHAYADILNDAPQVSEDLFISLLSFVFAFLRLDNLNCCLLYTSDAADDWLVV